MAPAQLPQGKRQDTAEQPGIIHRHIAPRHGMGTMDGIALDDRRSMLFNPGDDLCLRCAHITGGTPARRDGIRVSVRQASVCGDVPVRFAIHRSKNSRGIPLWRIKEQEP
jgi:hypothetical protein